MTAQTMHAPDFRAASAHLRMALAAVVLAAFFVALVRSAPALHGAGSPATAPVFAPTALGTSAVATSLSDRPSGGRELAAIPPGVTLDIAGRVDMPVGLVGSVSYWVRLDGAGTTRYGFVQARDIVVTSGEPAAIDLAGRPVDAFLRPEDVGDGSRAIGAPSVPEGYAAPASVASPSSGAIGSWQPVWLPASVTRWSVDIEGAAAAHGVDPALVALVVLVESGGLTTAQSGAGALGLMQLMPGTAAEVAERIDLPIGTAGLTDPTTNIRLGTAYLAQMLAEFGRADDPDWQSSVELAAAAYNAGPGHVGQHITTGAPLFAESAAYRGWVGGMWRERSLDVSPTYEAWLAAGGSRLVEAAVLDGGVY